MQLQVGINGFASTEIGEVDVLRVSLRYDGLSTGLSFRLGEKRVLLRARAWASNLASAVAGSNAGAEWVPSSAQSQQSRTFKAASSLSSGAGQ